MAELTLVQSDSSDSDSGVRAFFPLTGVQNIDALPPEILDLVFRLLDQNSLRQTRLVCRKLNDLALQILSQTPGAVHLYLDENGRSARGLERIKKLQYIIRLTKYPGMFFTELTLHGDVPVGDIQLLNFLQEFGSTLKSLKLSGISLPLPILRQILEKWCVNLEKLDIQELGIRADNNSSVDDLEKLPILLNLNLLEFKFHHFEEPLFGKGLIFSIVKRSPKLKALHLNIVHKQYDFGFWKNVRSLPNITKNLEEVKMVTSPKGITDLVHVTFSNKLTSLRLEITHTSVEITNTSVPKELATLLKGVEESLEKLFLHVAFTWDVDGVSNTRIELPLMKKLNVLELSCSGRRFFDFIDCLKKLPNLEILRLSNWSASDAVFPTASCFRMCLYKNLNTLALTGFILSPEATFVINRMFPNLRDLTLGLLTHEIAHNIEPTDKSWFIGIFTGIGEMKNLKILNLVIYDVITCDWSGINFEVCFSLLEASESLEELTITHHFCCGTYPQKFPPGLEKALVKIPKLKVLTPKYFHMEESEWMKAFETLGQKGILLKPQ